MGKYLSQTQLIESDVRYMDGWIKIRFRQIEPTMPRITFIEFDGTEHTVEGVVGNSLMRAAIDNNVPGIDADCGGECSCATCHVILNDFDYINLGSLSENEDSMLGLNPETTQTSRLSCQITVTEELDGIRVQIPEFQF